MNLTFSDNLLQFASPFSRQRQTAMNTVGQRIVVLGVTGSGKSTLSQALAALYDLHYIELDNLFWKPNWTMSDDEEFLSKVKTELDKSDCWVVDGNYMRVGAPYIWQRADTFIWLDYPLYVNYWRLWKRTWGRFLKREKLWDAENTESLWKHFLTKDSLFYYAASSHAVKRERYTKLLTSSEFADYNRIHLQSPAQTNQWLADLKTAMR